MQTKILLSVLAILSISFIGLARPGNSSGSHAEAGSLTDTTVTAPVDSHETPIVSQDQDKKEQKKGVKKKVKKEDKEKEKTILVWTAKEGEKGTYEIIIDKDDPKKIIFVTSPHAEHDKDTKAYCTIKSDKLHFSEDVKTIKLDKGAVIHIKKGDIEGVEVIELDPDHITVDVHVSPHVEVHPKVHVVIDTEKYAKLIEKIKEKLAKLK